MDIVYIRDLRVEAIIGIYDWEREIKQVLSFDLEMASDIRPAAKTDNIDQALNYKAVAKHIIELVSHSEFLLVETLAEQIAEQVIEQFNVPWLRLRVSKPGAVRGAQDVGILMERGDSQQKPTVAF